MQADVSSPYVRAMKVMGRNTSAMQHILQGLYHLWHGISQDANNDSTWSLFNIHVVYSTETARAGFIRPFPGQALSTVWQPLVLRMASRSACFTILGCCTRADGHCVCAAALQPLARRPAGLDGHQRSTKVGLFTFSRGCLANLGRGQ